MVQVIRTAPRLHPLVAAAAISVIAVSAAGVGVMTGVLPGSHASNAPLAAPAGATASGVPQSLAIQNLPAAPATRAAIEAPAPAVVVEKPAPRALPKPRVVKVATAERAYEEPVRSRPVEVWPADESPVGREMPAPQGRSSAGGAYDAAPIQVTQAPVAKPVCANCGVIDAIIETEKAGEGSGVGIAGGALGGAVIGKQFGNGRGQDALTILGAIGGAIAGHQVEKKVRSTKVYEVRVRMEDGSIRSVNQTTAPTWRSGDRVRLDGGNISLNT